MSDYLPLAVRVFTERSDQPKRPRRSGKPWKRPRFVLVFDTETSVDHAQSLIFGCVRIYRWDPTGLALVREYLFHADELASSDPDGFETLTRYAAKHDLKLISRRDFLKLLWRYGYQLRVWVVGFNLPFDFARISVGWGSSRKSGRGGFSLQLWDYEGPDGVRLENRYRPRLNILTIDSKRALTGFRSRREPDPDDLIPEDSDTGEQDPSYVFPGNFLDLRTLAFALTNEGHTLASACKAFSVPHKKQKVEQHGQITPGYIGYCRRDVLATTELLEALIAEYERHPILLHPTEARSPAAIAKAYLDGMGITPPLVQNPNFPRSELGRAMTAYVGGRCECRLRRTPIPVVYVDFLSMYPTVNALMNLWPFTTAERIETVDATDTVRTFVDEIELADCFQQDLWRKLPVLCLVEPNGEILPARCGYSGAGWQIGINPLTSNKPLWFALPDVIAAKLLTGRAPHILEAVEYVPGGQQAGLRPLKLRGEVEIDPSRDDVFRRIIEERKRLENRHDLTKTERERLSETLKVTANSGSYGINAEMTRHELGRTETDVDVYGLAEPFVQKIEAVEKAGRYCFPPLAACVTAGARLMLTLLERAVSDLGGSSVFCDTDSLAIVATRHGGPVATASGTVHALSFSQVDEIVARFKALSPYDPAAVPGSILKIEDINYNPKGGRRQLYAYSISAKRYCLYRLSRDGRPIIVKHSEHGLGHLLNPIDAELTDRDWIKETWTYLVSLELGLDIAEPAWLDRPALSKLSITSPPTLEPFDDFNQTRPLEQQIKPYNFLLTAHVSGHFLPLDVDPTRFRLVAPYERDPSRWLELPWINLYTGSQHRIAADGVPAADEAIRIKTYRDIIGEYATQPEPKSLDPDGTPCRRSSRGLLKRRPVTVTNIELIGKESNRLEERTAHLISSLDDVLNTYDDPNLDPWHTLVVPTLSRFNTAEIAQLAQLDRRTIQRYLKGSIYPHRSNRQSLTEIAASLARTILLHKGVEPPVAALAILRLYLERLEPF